MSGRRTTRRVGRRVGKETSMRTAAAVALAYGLMVNAMALASDETTYSRLRSTFEKDRVEHDPAHQEVRVTGKSLVLVLPGAVTPPPERGDGLLATKVELTAFLSGEDVVELHLPGQKVVEMHTKREMRSKTATPYRRDHHRVWYIRPLRTTTEAEGEGLYNFHLAAFAPHVDQRVRRVMKEVATRSPAPAVRAVLATLLGNCRGNVRPYADHLAIQRAAQEHQKSR